MVVGDLPEREALLADLQRDEGVRLFPYDSGTGELIRPGHLMIGNVTVGVGRDLNTHGLTLPEALAWEASDAGEAYDSLAKMSWFQPLDMDRKRVLVEMAFNIGAQGVAQFSMMIGALRREDWAEAATEMLASRWAKQVGGRANRLAEIMKNGSRGTSG